MSKLKNRIAPKPSDKTLLERLNEVCEKHGVSTLQDLDWAFCESEKRDTKHCIEAEKLIYHQKWKRCLAMARWCDAELEKLDYKASVEYTNKDIWRIATSYFTIWHKRWLKLAEKFKDKEAK